MCSEFNIIMFIGLMDDVKCVHRAGDAVSEDTVNDLESDKNCEETLSESLIEMNSGTTEETDTDVKKARSRKTKFK